MTNILITHPSADLYGSDRVMLGSVEGLVAAGAAVTVTLPSDGPLVGEIRARGADVTFCPTPVLRRSLLHPLRLIRAGLVSIRDVHRGLRLLRRVRPDVVYVNTVTTPLWLVIARLGRVPALCHVHEAESTAPTLVRRALATPLRLSRSIVANSRFTSDVLTSAAPSLGARVRVIYNAVPGPRESVEPRDEIVGALQIVYVGRLSPRKGVDLVIDAVSILREHGVEARVQLVGAVFPGFEWYEEQLTFKVAELGLTDQVSMTGFRPSVWSELASADIVVAPSRVDESFGNAAVEAMLAARPLVVSNIPGLCEAAGSYASAVFVEPDDPTAIAEALTRIRREWATFRHAAIADREEALVRHNPSAYGRAIAEATFAIAAGRWAS